MAESTDGESYQGARMYPTTVLPQDNIKLIITCQGVKNLFPSFLASS